MVVSCGGVLAVLCGMLVPAGWALGLVCFGRVLGVGFLVVFVQQTDPDIDY